MPVRRGGIYGYQGIRRRGQVLAVSVDSLNAAGIAMVVEVVTEPPPQDLRMLVTVELGPQEVLPGAWVLCWRMSYAHTSRLDTTDSPGHVSTDTLARVVTAINALIAG